jgi:hypothetical protein
VSEYSRQEIAQRAGVDPDYVDRLVELGILMPAAGRGRTRTPRYRVCSSPSQRRSGLRPDPDAVQHPLITSTVEAPGSPSSGGWTCLAAAA